jgi:hypothetical protein
MPIDMFPQPNGACLELAASLADLRREGGLIDLLATHSVGEHTQIMVVPESYAQLFRTPCSFLNSGSNKAFASHRELLKGVLRPSMPHDC